jgi:hypothetical protein
MIVQPFQATGRDWLVCAGTGMCGLCGPRDVLEALAARLTPASVLAEAERLLRGVFVYETQFLLGKVGGMSRGDYFYEPTLADLYAVLLKEGK